MKEIIEGLNLPKQILDKTEKFMSKLLGPSIIEYGELFADKIRFKRLKNQIAIFNKTRELLEKNNLEPNELNLKQLVPLIEKSSVEEEEFMQDKWAKLIANISTSPENGLEPRLINTLSSLSSMEAKILDFLFEEFEIKRNLKHASIINKKSETYSIENIKVSDITIRFKSVKSNFELTDEFAKIYIDNLESLGLLRYCEPEIDIDDWGTYADLTEDEKKNPSIDLNLEIVANYTASDDFHLTAFGKYFANQCRVE